jgi:hypothetical protein
MTGGVTVNTTVTNGYKFFVNGTAAGTSGWITHSDIRLKHNINPLKSAKSVINALKPVEFDWKADNKHHIGFIAQDVYKVVPSMRTHCYLPGCKCTPENSSRGILCSEIDHDYPVDASGNPIALGLATSEIVPFLTQALQETMAELTQANDKIQKLENFIRSKFSDYPV